MGDDRVLIKGGTLIDGTGRAPSSDTAVLIELGKIKAVGAGALLEASAGPAPGIVDASNQYVLPGLIDGHVHLSMVQGTPAGIRFPTSAEHCTLRAAQHLPTILRAGFTSVSVPGGKWFVDVALREAVETGILIGPRIFAGGRALTPYGGIFDQRPSWEHGLPDDLVGVLCNKLEDFVVETRRQSKHGVDLIKIADSFWGDTQTVARGEIAAVVEEAHRRNVKVAIHSRGSGTTRDAALAGVDWIFHADHATAEDLDAVARAGMPIMPTFAQGEIWANHGLEVPQATKDRLRRQLEINVKAIQAAKKLGIKLLIGTDSGNAPVMTIGKWHGYEAAFFVQHLGYSPLEVISIQTRDNALVMGLAGSLGTIEPGMIADVIVLDADPSKRIEVLGDPAHVRTVIKDGRVIDLAVDAGSPSLAAGRLR
jgi:imidazolonepropionase-like amidohydrolase